MKLFLSLFLVLSLASASFAFGGETDAASAPARPMRDYSTMSLHGCTFPSSTAFRFDDAGDPPPEDDGCADVFGEALGLFREGNYAEAVQASEVVMKNYSGTVWEGRGAFLAARASAAAGSLDKASEYFQLSKKDLAPLSGYADYLLATSMRRAGRYGDAIKLYISAAREARAVSVESTLQAGDIALLIHKYDQVEELIKPLLGEDLARGSAARADYLMTMALAGEKDSKDAIKHYEILWRDYPGLSFGPRAGKRLLELDMKIPDPGMAERMGRAESCMKHGFNQDALESYNKVYREAGEKPELRMEALLGEGQCYFRLRDDDHAREALHEALDMDGLPSDKASRACLLLALMRLREGDMQKFSDIIYKCSDKYPDQRNTAHALYLLGTVLSQKGDYDGALAALGKLSAEFPEWHRMDEELWQTGWAQYKKGDYQAAQESFSKLCAGYPDSSLAPQALYWRAKALGQSGDKKDAGVLISQLQANYPYSFYGLIAGLPPRLYSVDPSKERIPGPEETGDGGMDKPPASPDVRLKAAYELGIQGLCGLAYKEVRYSERLFRLPHEGYKIADAYHFIGEYRRPLELFSSSCARRASEEKGLSQKSLRTMFPLPDWDAVYLAAKGYRVDPWLISAVIREESHCYPDAVSPVGAVGLMQIMEGTAAIMCRKMDVCTPGEDGLKNCGFNIPIGSFYLRQLLKKDGGRLAFVLAEYNAGARCLAKWKAEDGDMPDDYFIENISYPETRGYVKKVLRNYFMYKKLYSPAH